MDFIDARPLLRPERRELLEMLARLDVDDWALPTECPAWTVQGVALHILGDDLSLLSRQRDVATNGLLLYAEDHPGLSFRELLDGFNEQWVTGSRFLSRELIIELLRLVGDWSADFYETVDPFLAGEPVGFFGGTTSSPHWHAIAREYVERWVHQHQIRRAAGLPDLGEEFAHIGVEAVLGGLAGLIGDVGGAVVVQIDGGLSWTLADGTAARGDIDSDAQLTIAAQEVTPVFSRGRSKDEVGRAFTIGGDDALAQRVLAGLIHNVGRP